MGVLPGTSTPLELTRRARGSDRMVTTVSPLWRTRKPEAPQSAGSGAVSSRSELVLGAVATLSANSVW